MRLAGLILANIWMYFVLCSATIAVLVLFAPWLALAALTGRSFKLAARKGIWLYGRVCALAARPAVRVRVNDPSALCNAPASVIVANHQSFYDTYLLGAQNADNVGMLIKGWPFRKLFFFRPIMRAAGYIEAGSEQSQETLARCHEELSGGGHLMGFPEGTRSTDGSLGRFHSGMFMLAMEARVKVIPMVIHDSHAVLPKGSRLFRPGTIHVDFLSPVDTECFKNELIPHGALRRHVRALMAECLEARKAARGKTGI